MKPPTYQFDMMCISSYSDDDDTESSISSGRTLSSISIDSTITPPTLTTNEHGLTYSSSALTMSFFQHSMESDPDVTISKNTYFMDGGSRFISVPMLGNTNTKGGSSISRLFEEWLANKLSYQPMQSSPTIDRAMAMESSGSMHDDTEMSIVVDQTLPILQDQVELIAEDILNTMKLSSYSWRRKGLDKVMIKIRTGHIYTYHSLEDGQPLITQDMEELFQRFPLFVECHVFTTTAAPSSLLPYQSKTTTQLLLSVENVTINPGHPYNIMDEF